MMNDEEKIEERKRGRAEERKKMHSVGARPRVRPWHFSFSRSQRLKKIPGTLDVLI